jgi:hypothetical protein
MNYPAKTNDASKSFADKTAQVRPHSWNAISYSLFC